MGGIGLIAFFSCIFLAQPAFSDVELVQSVPLETDLTVPGIPMTQDVWLQMVQNAKSTIDLEQYYMSPGDSLQPILQAIEDAATRGVHVRMLLDASFLKTNSTGPTQFLSNPNIEVRSIDFSATGGIQHAKYIVVDGTDIYSGSANFDWLALSHIHEVGLHITDAQLGAKVESIFNQDWPNGLALTPPNSSSTQSPAVCQNLIFPQFHQSTLTSFADDSGLQIVASPMADAVSGIPDTLASILQLMSNAQKTIQIQVYEYSTTPFNGGSPWKDLDNGIRAAVARGVQVQMIVDATVMRSGKKDLQALAKLPNVSITAITIPQWSGGPLQYARLIHSKYMIVDGALGWVGSENWIDTYFTGSRNVGTIINSTNLAQGLNSIFTTVWNSPYGVAVK